MTRTAYLDCISGIAGDMLLAALIDAGADSELLHGLPAALGLDGVQVQVEHTYRQGIAALLVQVVERAPGTARSWADIRSLLTGASLEAEVRERAIEVFARLARAESAVHGVAQDDVHFHELGGADALIDICGTCSLVHDLAVDRLVCSPLPLARGLISAAHGRLPLPAPATLALLEGAPVYGIPSDRELVTPTGAALAVSLADEWGELPPIRLKGVGYGSGTRDDPGRPNLLRVILGEPELAGQAPISIMETNLDDLSPQLVPDAVDSCFEAGALDVWVTPIQMKKGRPGITLAALARPDREQLVARALLRHTTTLGVRIRRGVRYELDREVVTVQVDGRPIRIKLGLLDGAVVNVAPEHDDCAETARASGRTVKAVWADALVAARGA
ncbi:MAG TPA: nickel pincer cofactor biosynthesis protein LarC [Gaiellales bacterium]|nr:nickel pincer cofactor biosynthesis protein LarC [Gaiellales bacterium]